jgi:hypothetical protein
MNQYKSIYILNLTIFKIKSSRANVYFNDRHNWGHLVVQYKRPGRNLFLV